MKQEFMLATDVTKQMIRVLFLESTGHVAEFYLAAS